MNDAEATLEDVVDQFTASLRAGGLPSIDAYARKYPAIADDIYKVLSSIQWMEQLSHSESDSRERANAPMSRCSVKVLGSFDIVREIGRGGMGVVYEAVDRTLKRRVALKVLNDSALTTHKNIDRFRRESRLAAQLHHTNIVPVFGVGEEDGKHFYAMQYVEGVSVYDIVNGLKELSDCPNLDSNAESGDWDVSEGLGVAAALRLGEFAEPRKSPVDVRTPSSASVVRNISSKSSLSGFQFEQTIDLSDSAAGGEDAIEDNGEGIVGAHAFDTARAASGQEVHPDSSSASAFGKNYWRSVARIGVQVADALHYAHVQGILHRDIKPANLLFDANGTVWVADFGLAKLMESDELTLTGDSVGTLRYMAPEQLSGKADARTDVYALGLTLYELLTLRPTHDGETYKTLFAQKQSTNHPSLRKLVPTIPHDLETIVQKALEMEVGKRYPSAREMSEDLQRFLDDRPILARRVGFSERAWRWCRRNRLLATMGAMIAGLFLLLPIILGWAYLREAEQKERSERTMNVVLEGFDDLFLSYLDSDAAAATALSSSGADRASFATAMLSRDTAEVMEKMLLVYDRLAEQSASGSNGTLAVESAKARRRVGDLYRKLGRFDKASEAYDDAGTRFAELAKLDITHQVEVARIHRAMGSIHEQRENMQLARTEYSHALEALADMPETSATQFERALTHYLLSKEMVREGSHGGGPNQLGAEFRPPPPAGDRPSDATYSEDERSAHREKAIALLDELLVGTPKHAEYRFLLALCLREANSFKEGREPIGKESAVELLSELVTQFPSVQRYRFELCETYRSYRSNSWVLADRIKNLQLARGLAEQLVEEQRDAAAYRINLAHIYAFLGIAYGGQGNIRQAEDFTRQAMGAHASVVKDFAGLAPLSYRLLKNDKIRLGSWLARLQRDEELIELIEPLGEQIFEQVNAGVKNDIEPSNESISGLVACRDLLLPAYEALGDDVGYLLASTWLNDLPSPNFDALDLGPPRFRPPGPPRGLSDRDARPRRASPIEMAFSYDIDGDSRITREEVPTRMAQEWFQRADANNDGNVDGDELETLLGPG